jgi:hypothetical protein
MVGRDTELALLTERWNRVVDGEGQAVLLTGEPGIGKSRISAALVEAVLAGAGTLRSRVALSDLAAAGRQPTLAGAPPARRRRPAR